MAKRNSTVLPVEVGLEYRRLFVTMCGAFSVLADLAEMEKSVDLAERRVALADALFILLSRSEEILDSFGVPRDWRKVPQ